MQIARHNRAVRFVHWSIALSIFALIFSGIGQMPVYKRYFVDSFPGLGWTSNYAATLEIHYYAAIVLIFSCSYYLVYLALSRQREILPQRGDFQESRKIFAALLGRGEEPPSGKYLAEQRLAFALTAVTILVLILSGLIKVYKNLPGIILPGEVVFWTAQVHNLFTVIMVFNIVTHLGAFIIKANWPLLPSMFTGFINREYVRHRHQKWWKELARQGLIPVEDDPLNVDEQASPPVDEDGSAA